jgi:hypothetical protein
MVGEITYHHDAAVFRKDQNRFVISSLGQKIDDPGGNANTWIPAPGLVNKEVINGGAGDDRVMG